MAIYLICVLLHQYIFLDCVCIFLSKNTSSYSLLPPHKVSLTVSPAPSPVYFFCGLWSIWFNRLPVADALTSHRNGALCSDVLSGNRSL